MREIMKDYQNGRTQIEYPSSIKTNLHAQAFYGMITALFAQNEREVDVIPDNDFMAQMSIDITEIFKSHIQVGWEQNITIQNRISQDIDDLFYEYEKSRGFKISFDLIDKIIENSKTVAMRRF